MEPEMIANIGAGIALTLLVVGGIMFTIGEWWANKEFYSED